MTTRITDLEYRNKATGKDESRRLYFPDYCRQHREPVAEKTHAGVEPVKKEIASKDD